MLSRTQVLLRMKLRSIRLGLLGLGLGIGLLELVLRFGLGLGNPPLMQADPKVGYRFQPNQKLFRFGKHIEYNQYSQRNAPIDSVKPPGTRRILVVGDSVINGGVMLDQSETVTEQLRSRLGTSVEVLNASAGSWAIENRIGYLQEFGTFQSDAIIFQVGTSDLIQPTSTGEMIGANQNFPNRRPWSALGEGWSRYLEPALMQFFHLAWTMPAYAQDPSPRQKSIWFAQNMQSFRQEIQSLQSNPATRNIPIVVLYTPNRVDVLPKATPPMYKAEFLQLLAQLKTPVVDVHTAWSALPSEQTAQYFIDGIHPTAAGSRAIADLLSNQLCAQSTWCKR
jgi:lysophospholipase L1-like esterase